GKLAPIGHRPRLGPLGMHIGGGDGPTKLSGHAFSAVSYSIGFNKACSFHIPVLSSDRDLSAKQSARPRPTTTVATQRNSAWAQQSIDSRCTNLFQFAPKRPR